MFASEIVTSATLVVTGALLVVTSASLLVTSALLVVTMFAISNNVPYSSQLVEPLGAW